MSSASSHPLPHLPLETQAAILRFCDPSTLAASSRVSLAWLELAGPILYEHITIRGKEQLEMMIRSESVLASVAPFVSLDQTRTFTYVPLEKDEPDKSNLDDSYDVSQTIAADPVPVEQLLVDLRNVHLETALDVHLDALLASFNPHHLHVLAQPIASSRVGAYLYLSGQLAWSNLCKATFTHSLPARMFLARIPNLAGRTPPLELVLDFSTSTAGFCNRFDKLVEELRDDLDRSGRFGKGRPLFGRVQLWLVDLDEVTRAKIVLVGCSCTTLDIAVKELAKSDA